METEVQQISFCYETLANPPDNESLQECCAFLEKLYLQPNAIDLLTEILNSTDSSSVQKHAIVGIGIIIRKQYKDLEVDDQARVFERLLDFMTYERSLYVRQYIVEFVQTCLKGEFVPNCENWINEAIESQNPIRLSAACFLATMCLPWDSENIGNIGPTLIETCLKYDSLEVRVSAVLHAVNLSTLIEIEENEQIVRWTKSTFELLNELSVTPGEERYLKKICNVLKYALDQRNEYIQPNQALVTCVSCLTSKSCSANAKLIIRTVTDCIISNYIDAIAEDKTLVQSILTVYFGLFVESFDPMEEFPDDCVLSSIFVDFSDYQEILDMFMESIPNFMETEAGKAASIVGLAYCVSNKEYFEDKLPALRDILTQSLKDQSVYIRQATATAISELAKGQGSDISIIANELLYSLLECLRSDVSPNYVYPMTVIIRIVKEVDKEVFSAIFQTLGELLTSDDSGLLLEVYWCLVTIVENSPNESRSRFGRLLEIFERPLAGVDELSSLLSPSSIRGMSYLMNSSKSLFVPHLQTFFEELLTFFNSDDDSLAYEAVNAYGRLIQTFTKEVQSNAENILDKLMEIASTEIHVDLEDDEEVFMGEENDTPLDKKVRVVGAAIKIMCCSLSMYTDLFVTHFKRVLEILQEQERIGDSDLVIACAGGACFLVAGFQKLGLNEATKPLISEMGAFLANIAANNGSLAEGAGEAFTGIADIIAMEEQTGFVLLAASIPKILEAISIVFSGKMVYQGGELSYIEDLHKPAQRVLREIMASIKEESIPIIQPFVPQMQELITFKSTAMKDLVLEFFGDLAFWASKGLDNEFKENVLTLAIDAVKTRQSAYGFGCFKQFAITSPDILKPLIPTILPLIAESMSSEEKTETQMIIQDNCVGALSKIAMNILQDEFPIDSFLSLCLPLMPPQVQVEENNDALEFMRWLMNRTNSKPADAYASVLIRLFSDGLDMMEEYDVSQENVEWGQNCLRTLLSQFANPIELISTVCDNDDFKIQAVLDALA